LYFLLISFSLKPVAPDVRIRLLAAGSLFPHNRISRSAENPVFMRVRENPPPFTLRLFNGFVNSKRRVSTGFCGFPRVFWVFWVFFTRFGIG
jgi:hypothetical protein